MPGSAPPLIALLLAVTMVVVEAAMPVARPPRVGIAAEGATPNPEHQLATLPAACSSIVPAATATPRSGALVGLELVLEMEPAHGQRLDTSALVGIRSVLQRRLALLDLSGEVVRRRDGRILVRVDATDDPQGVTHAIAATMLLEIIDPEGHYLPPGTPVRTTLGGPGAIAWGSAATPAAPSGGGGAVYETILSGADFSDAYVTEGTTPGVEMVGFAVSGEAATKWFQFTSTHVGEPMSIVIDKRVITSPRITGAIATRGLITGMPADQVPVLVAQLKAGALEVPLALVECRIVPASARPPLAGTPEASIAKPFPDTRSPRDRFEQSEANECAGQGEQSLEQVSAPLIANAQAAKAE